MFEPKLQETNEAQRLQQAAHDALLSGSAASVLSAAVLSWRSKLDEGSAAGGLNGPSQWVWGEKAARSRRLSLQTGVGYVIHHATSVFWAVIYERLCGSRHPRVSKPRVVIEALGVAAGAYVVDYYFTPSRLQPGFEKHITPKSMVMVYAAFAAGLALTTLLRKHDGNS